MDIDEKFNVCELSNIITEVKGLPSNSNSPSDTWIVTFKDGITYRYNHSLEILHSGFLKIFINTENLTYKSPHKLGLEYELKVYKIIKNILNYKISPNFVRLLAHGEKCSYEDLLNILLDKLPSLKDRRQYINSLNRNLYYIMLEKDDRPAIQSKLSLSMLNSVNFSDYKYNIILTKNMENNITFNQWLKSYKEEDNLTELWNILFQVASACYIMSLCKMVHNDLHTDNIFLHKLENETYFLYNINDTRTVIKTRYQVLIYDFDRAYAQNLGDNPLNEENCKKFSQCNILIENKDIIKVLCHIYKYVNEKMKNIILNLLTTDNLFQSIISNSYNYRSRGIQFCFLQYNDETGIKSLPTEWYSNFNDNFHIIQKIRHELYQDYSPTLVLDNNIFTYAKDFFDDDGKIILERLEKIRKFDKEESKDFKSEFEFELDVEDFDLSFDKFDLSNDKSKTSEPTSLDLRIKKVLSDTLKLLEEGKSDSGSKVKVLKNSPKKCRKSVKKCIKSVKKCRKSVKKYRKSLNSSRV